MEALRRADTYPRLRYVGSKYRLLPQLAEVFAQIGGRTALDPFSGSGVVAHLLKGLGFETTIRDYLAFPVTIANAATVNQGTRLSADVVQDIVRGDNLDGRDFISRTYSGRFFTVQDLTWLDAAWSRIDRLTGSERALATAGLVLSAARKQPRGVFTVTQTAANHDDGRRHLRMTLAEHFVEAVDAWSAAVFDGPECRAEQGDVSTGPSGFGLVYLDPPYAPPRDDNDYLKRYWFLEGLADYWAGGTAQVMAGTLTRKLPKRWTAFGSRTTIEPALASMFEKHRASTIVLSYGSNAVPALDVLVGMLRDVKGAAPEVHRIPHRYHFGTKSTALRREAEEFILVAA